MLTSGLSSFIRPINLSIISTEYCVNFLLKLKSNISGLLSK